MAHCVRKTILLVVEHRELCSSLRGSRSTEYSGLNKGRIITDKAPSAESHHAPLSKKSTDPPKGDPLKKVLEQRAV